MLPVPWRWMDTPAALLELCVLPTLAGDMPAAGPSRACTGKPCALRPTEMKSVTPKPPLSHDTSSATLNRPDAGLLISTDGSWTCRARHTPSATRLLARTVAAGALPSKLTRLDRAPPAGP